MKKILYLLLAVVGLISFSCSETEEPPVDPIIIPPADCNYHGLDIKLTTQAEVDAFAAHAYCKLIDAHLTIGSRDADSNITSLAGLSTITRTNGNIIIVNNPLLTSLQGLHNIKGASTYEINNNSSLVNLNGIGQVNVLTDASRYNIIGNGSLLNLQGFENIQYIHSIQITNCPNFNSLQGLDNCKTIVGELEISYCPMITSLNHLQSVEQLMNLEIVSNQSFNSLQGLDLLENINSIKLEDNQALSSLAGLENLIEITYLNIIKNHSLTTLEGLENITKYNSLSIKENNGLSSLLGLQNTTEINRGDLEIIGNTSLTNIADLSSLVKIQGYYQSTSFLGNLKITSNPLLTSLNGLQNVTTFNNSLYIYSNNSLTDLCPLLPIKQIGTIHYMIMGGNANPVTYGDLNASNCN